MNETLNKNYHVAIKKDGKDVLSDPWQDKSSCVAYASELSKLNFYDKVSVITQLDDGKRSSIYENTKNLQKKCSDTILCEHVKDLLLYDSRKIITKVLEPLLQPNGKTAIEAIFSQSFYKNAQKQETIVINAIKKVSSGQSKKHKINEDNRYDILFKIFNDIPKFHELTAPLTPYVKILEEKGIEVLISSVKKNLSANMHEVAVYFALAKSMKNSKSFIDKLEVIIEFYEKNLSDKSKKFLDELIAEVCNRDDIFLEIKNNQFEKKDQIIMLADLCTGIYKAENTPKKYISYLCGILKDPTMVQTKKVFTNFIQIMLRDVSPICQESQDEDRLAFERILSKLFFNGVLIGDGKLAESLVLKGQQVYGDKFGEQSSTEETILKILKKLPTPIAKAKFFMGLSIAGKNNKYNKMIERKLATTITSWRLVEDAVPPNGNKTYTIKTLFRLLESVEKSSLSRLIKSQIENHISNMLLNKEAIFPGKGFFSDIQPVTQEENQDEEENVSKSGFNRQTYQKGEYIFHEGHAGNEAYLIVSGEVEIFKETTTEKTTLGNLGRGALFGEMSIIDNEPRMAAAMAKEQTTLTIIPKESFKEKLDKLEEFDPVLRRMIDVFINRIRSNANSNK